MSRIRGQEGGGVSQALFTDLYELTMMAGYHAAGRAEEEATFDLFFRHPPRGVDLVVAAGLEQVLDYLQRLRFTDADLAYLRSLNAFDDDFLDYLAQLRFTGDVWAVPEGLPVFGDEPIVRVTAALGQAQLVETALLNRICYASLVASNAVQMVTAARGKTVVEFGARRAHGPDGALTASRAAVVGGCASTSNVQAGQRFGLSVSGTQAHSWVMAFDSELQAFRTYASAFPDRCILLVDTYDTLASGVPNAITVAHELAVTDHQLQAIRLDSGDLATLAAEARRMLDDAGFPRVRILASGDLDAPRIAELEEQGAPIDAYGVGTSLVTAWHDPALSGVYKLAEIAGQPVLKISGTPEKTTSPGRKQVWRSRDGDVIGLADESLAGEPLLAEVVRDGTRVRPPVPVEALRDRCRDAVARIRPHVIDGAWTVRRSPRLDDLRNRMVATLRAGGR
jgi:nicotinate phosphoribosyltransferase